MGARYIERLFEDRYYANTGRESKGNLTNIGDDQERNNKKKINTLDCGGQIVDLRLQLVQKDIRFKDAPGAT